MLRMPPGAFDFIHASGMRALMLREVIQGPPPGSAVRPCHCASQASPVHYPPAGCHDRAVLLYEYVGKRMVDLQHTEVPDAYRGRGIAKHLAKAALDFVVEEDLKAHLTCWYIQKYVKENPLPQYLERLQP